MGRSEAVRSVSISFERFAAGLSNFFTLFEPVANSWQMFDNSEEEGPRLIAEREPDAPASIHDREAWQRLEAVGR